MRFSAFAFFLLCLLINSACSQSIPSKIELEEAFPNLNFTNPVDLQSAKDGTNRLFVVEQAGRIIVFKNDINTSTRKVFLDITDKVSWGGEMGLLGLTFHPDFSSNGYFYVNYTASNPRRTVISRFNVSTINPDSADKNSELILMTFNQPYSNHNGGCLAFGPDGYLYIATGDGGSAGDPQNNAQNINNLLGKILRIDVDNPQASLNYGIPSSNPFVDSTNSSIRKEIYAYGLRNPWRFSFDILSDRLWCADVGQNAWEEVNIIVKGGNYGWRCFEGSHPYNLQGCESSSKYVPPVFEYSHSEGQSITGGYVYRGKRVTDLQGKYIYGDFVSRKIWALTYNGQNEPPLNEFLGTCQQPISSFGIDDNNEVYIVGYQGKIYRFAVTTGINEFENQYNNLFPEFKQNFPNPFNSSTVIQYSLPDFLTIKMFFVQIDLYNSIGEKVKTIFQKEQPAGNYEIKINFDDLKFNQTNSNGVYFLRMISNNFTTTIKLLLIK